MRRLIGYGLTLSLLICSTLKAQSFSLHFLTPVLLFQNSNYLILSILAEGDLPGNKVCFKNSSSPDCIRLIQQAWSLNSTREAVLIIEKVESLIRNDLLFVESGPTVPFTPIELALECLSTRRFPHGALCFPCSKCLTEYYFEMRGVCELFCPTANITNSFISATLSTLTTALSTLSTALASTTRPQSSLPAGTLQMLKYHHQSDTSSSIAHSIFLNFVAIFIILLLTALLVVSVILLVVSVINCRMLYSTYCFLSLYLLYK